MSNPILDELLKFFADQGLTIDVLAGLPEDDLNLLLAPAGTPLNVFQKMALKGAVNNYRMRLSSGSSASRPGTSSASRPGTSSASRPRTSSNSRISIGQPSGSQIRIQQLEEENKKLLDLAKTKVSVVEEGDRLKVERKHKISHFKSYFEYASAKALKDVQKMMRELRRLGSDLDICFCIDGTGSMSDDY